MRFKSEQCMFSLSLPLLFWWKSTVINVLVQEADIFFLLSSPKLNWRHPFFKRITLLIYLYYSINYSINISMFQISMNSLNVPSTSIN